MNDKPQLPLQGKRIVVTGGTSGIGQAVAVKLAEQGASVLIHGRALSSRSDNVLEQLRSTSTAIGDQDAVHFASFADFGGDLDWQAWVDQVWDQLGPCDGWINNAGGDVLTNEWTECSLADKLDYLWRVDVRATLMLSRAVGARMIDDVQAADLPAGSKTIINVGWDQAAQGMAGDSGELFAATKGAVMAMTRSLAQSMAPHVRVNCVAPGWIKTKWGESTSDYWDQRARSESLMQRWGTAEDVANAMLFLCLPSSGFVSGQVLPVNGGFRMGDQKKS